MQNKFVWFGLIVVVLANLTGCFPKANLALGKLSDGNPKDAWEMVSQEISNPTVSSQKEYCELHGANLQILTAIMKYDFAPADPDPIANKSYDYILLNCVQFKKEQGLAEVNFGMYFQATNRPGQAISHIKKSMRYFDKLSFGNIANETNLGVAYAEMGQLDLRDHHRNRSINMAREYFQSPRKYTYSLDEVHEYLNFKTILDLRLDELSWSENFSEALPEMHKLWSEIESINTKWASKPTQYYAYTHASQLFAVAGDIQFARKLLNTAKNLVKEYSSNPETSKINLQFSEAMILTKEGKHSEAASLYNDLVNRNTKVSHNILSGNNFRLVGLANERAGNYDIAIESFEKAINDIEKRRSSFEVNSRGQVISGLVATTYWGLLRSYAARYQKHGNPQDLQAALSAEGKLRARQFGELLGIDNKVGQAVDISKLNLRTDELLLDYVLTDSSLVIFAISKGQSNLVMIPFNAKEFNGIVRIVKSKLSQPGDPDEFTADLLSISKTVLKPIGTFLKNKKKIIVISDGYLNGIPFGLLSKSDSVYSPLIKDHEIVLSPSISYLMTEKNAKTVKYDKALFALADPVFGKIETPEEYRDDTEVFYTRSVKDMNVFMQLPETRDEVKRISQLLQPGVSEILSGQDATKANVKAQQLTGYRYLHFATHGILGNQIPGVNEPALVLSQNSGQSEEAFLTLTEIEGMKLNNDLTVLSACDTGSGKYYTGEGTMGLSRGFLLAGSKSVLASLWPIDSQATVKFMVSFYNHLKSGKTKSESLRLTQLEFMKVVNTGKSSSRGIKVTSNSTQKSKFSHPYYWAPFVLTGE